MESEDPFLTPDPPPETATTATTDIIESAKHPRPAAFIGYLLGKAQQDSPKDADRQALAELRGILRGAPGDYLRAARHVAPFLGDRVSSDDRWFYLVGGLLALHPRHIRPNAGERVGPSLGVALGKLRSDKGGSADSRFLALLNTPAPSLGKALRQSVALLAQAGVGLDYTRLLYDLTRWEDPERRVQKQWARDYFRADFGAKAKGGATADADSDDNDSTDDESETE